MGRQEGTPQRLIVVTCAFLRIDVAEDVHIPPSTATHEVVEAPTPYLTDSHAGVKLGHEQLHFRILGRPDMMSFEDIDNLFYSMSGINRRGVLVIGAIIGFDATLTNQGATIVGVVSCRVEGIGMEQSFLVHTQER